MTLEFAKLGLDHIATHNIYAAGNDSNNNSTMIQETRIGLIQVKKIKGVAKWYTVSCMYTSRFPWLSEN